MLYFLCFVRFFWLWCWLPALKNCLCGSSRNFSVQCCFCRRLFPCPCWAFYGNVFFNPNSGLLNTFIHAIGFENVTPTWLGDANIAIFCCIFVSQWQYTGYCMLLDLVGIQKIPRELYEVAEIDGAGAVKRFFYVTLPMGKESMLVTSIITVIGSFKIFTEIQVMTGGGPGRATEVLATAMYRSAFTNDEMGVASAYAMIIFVITLILSLIQMKVSHTGEE